IIEMVSPQEVCVAERIIRDHVLRNYEQPTTVDEEWRDLPEIPKKSEILPEEAETIRNDFFVEAWDAYQKEPLYDPNLPQNIINGPWPSKEAYIAAHYQIIREDAIAGLRNTVNGFKREPRMDDDNLTHVYTHVHFKGMVLSNSGPAFRIEFSHERAGKQIRWQQSNRLQQGTMVALSPMDNSFRSVCKVAIVAARPFEGGLDQNPPQIDLFWGDICDTVFDPAESYVMVEARTGYFEASRHMLVALQKLRTEKFHLSKHLAELNQDIGAPEWLEKQRFLNLTSLIQQDLTSTTPIPAEEELALVNADILEGFPKIPSSGMDVSQLQACERMITKKVSIVQGPPGTGKTFTSVSALRILIENMDRDSPPIIISAQTNHALDQLMNHILAFEPNVLRLGGRSDKENIEVRKRTLHSLRSTTKEAPNCYRGMKPVKIAMEKIQRQIQETMDPLITESILSVETLFQAGIITEAQKKSLDGQGVDDDEIWANTNSLGNNAEYLNALHQWLGSNLIPMPHAPLVNHGLPMEESDLEFEQLREFEEENEHSPEDKGLDALSGVMIAFGRTMTSRCPPAAEDRKIKKFLASKKDLYEIPPGMRGQVYRYFEKQLNKMILAKLKEHLKQYKSAVDNIQIAKSKWLNNFRLIKHLGIKVIGCTTTGMSKYRGLLAALQPRCLLVEEAAETLEGTVMAGMFESLEQLILVGDHKQLQANANIRDLMVAPYHLSISMFERLVGNSIGFTMLNQQRRMIPDVRKLLCIEPDPFYKNLHDHPSVLDRKANRVPVPGMGGKDTYFFHHNWPELKSSDMSQCNPDEADMIVEFFNYLVLNGVPCSKITVLTFYNGQRKTILQALKRHHSLGSNTYFNVFTVDSYQGEENDVILLSLVRSNDRASIGFLDSKNRLVVALSRARRGLYIFGNSITLTTEEMPYGEDLEGYVRDPIWHGIIHQMRRTARFDLDGGLPVTCSNHNRLTRVYDAGGWDRLAGGGCDQPCAGSLACGHMCPYPCHPFDHSQILCTIACTKTLKCGHGCSGQCAEDCYCAVAECRNVLGSSEGYNEQGGHDLPFAGDVTWGSPTKNGKIGRNLVAQQPRPAASSASPEKSIYGSRNIKKTEKAGSLRREFSGRGLERDLSTGNRFRRPDVLSQRNYSSSANNSPSKPSNIGSWKAWDARKADKEANDERVRMAALPPKFDAASLVYNDTYRAVTIDEKGVRVKNPQSSSTTIIPRIDPSFLDPKSKSIMAAPATLLRLPSEKAKGSSTPLPGGPSTQTNANRRVGMGDSESGLSGATTTKISPGMNDAILLLSPFITPAESTTERISRLSIDDLHGLKIVPDTFGTAEDLDEFEKLLCGGI
ncbi:Helicase required for RNAi-mediated heterochromatin assembly 1, partial [Hyphodiscus hymeniophilus]